MTGKKKKKEGPEGFTSREAEANPLYQRALMRPESFRQNEDGTVQVELVVTTGGAVRRFPFFSEPFDERLEISSDAIRSERLESGRMPLLDNHRSFGGAMNQIGVIRDFTIDAGADELRATAVISAREELEWLRNDIRTGIIGNVSVGYRVHQFRDETEKGDEARQLKAIDWEPFEASIVTVPADPDAGLRSADQLLQSRSEGFETNPVTLWEPETETKDMAPKPKATAGASADSDQDVDQRAQDTPAPAPAPALSGPSQDDVDAARAAGVKAERERQTAIRAKVQKAGFDPNGDLASRLIEDGTSVERSADMILDALATRDEETSTRNAVSYSVGTDDVEKMGRAASDAILVRANMVDAITTDPQERRQRLEGNPFMSRSLMQIGEEMLQRAGVNTRMMGKRELAGAILRPRVPIDQRGLHSTSDFPGILENIAEKTLRRQYELQRETYSQWTRRGTLPDFKTAKRVQVGNAPALKLKPEGAEYEWATFGEQSEPILLGTYGRIVGMTREMMINDDLDAFMRIPRAFGGSARQLISDLVYAHVTGNTVMADTFAYFSTDHSNLITAAGNSLSVTSLSNTRELARRQRTIDPGDAGAREQGFLMDIDLVHLRVPEQLETTAQQLVAPLQEEQVSNVNPFKGSVFQSVMAEPRLGADSATAFYMFADPGMIDTVEVAFLQGEDGPVVDQMLEFDVDALKLRVRLDVGTSPIDFRGSYRNDGAA